MHASAENCLPPQRFQIRRRIGAGGMGVVYEAYDQERDEIVALKRLLPGDPSSPSRFKKEFRTLADLVHPNLITLYELVVEEDQCFFTMELLDGGPFVEYVRPRNHSLTGRNGPHGPDLRRLESALKQLAEGVMTLHETGIIHRDLKPSNVMVTPDDRVVILDFGLATEFAPLETLITSDGVAGTLAYLAPEIIKGGRATPASDWYSVGVILYETLTGHLPFQGNFYEMLQAKQTQDPVPVQTAAPDSPAYLAELCMAMLARDPGKRPSGEYILEKIGVISRNVTAQRAARVQESFVGRHAQLFVMEHAFEVVQRGDPVSLYVYGPSDMGKTALVHQFLEGLRRRVHVVTLTGRCYERESIPFKAVDGVIDSLTKHLNHLRREEADTHMPRGVHALARLFPVLLQVESIADAPQPIAHIPDPLSQRRQAFSALRELLTSLSKREQIVIYIDDFHWADPDSTALIEDLLQPPNPPRFLLLVSFRSEEIEAKPFLQMLLEQPVTEACVPVQVSSLSDGEVSALISSIVPQGRSLPHGAVENIVREAGGNPFFAEQLVRHVLESEQTHAGSVTLSEMLEMRMSRLPSGARQLMQTVAVAGKPVDFKVASDAAGVRGEERRLVANLRAAHLLRSSLSVQMIEPYHDRIRETIVASLDADTVRQIHKLLAHTLIAHGFDDSEALLEHYLAAGDQQLAAGQAVAAARKARSALAFDRAALLYRRAIDLSGPEIPELIELEIGLAEALANAGRAVDAAHVYLDSAKRASPAKALEFRERAAAQFLVGGHIDEGIQVMRDVLDAVGLKLPSSPKMALASLLFHRVWIRLRGLNFRKRDSSQILEKDRLRLDACWSVATVLAIVDTIYGNAFMARHLLLALRAGDPYRVARGLALEASSMAVVGKASRKRTAQFLELATSLASSMNSPHVTGLIDLAYGFLAFFAGEWRKSLDHFSRAEEIFRDRCTGVTWELAASQFFQAGCLQRLGELGTVYNRRLALLASAQARGNLFVLTHFRTRLSDAWLAADDPGRAEREVLDAIQRWSHKGFHIQHFTALVALTHVDLYRGQGTQAYQRVQSQWSSLSLSLLMRVQTLRVEAIALRARSALAVAEESKDHVRWLRVADRQARRLARENAPWVTPFVSLIRSAIAAKRRDVQHASALLSAAAEGFEQQDMALYAAAARRRLGEILGGNEGRRFVEDADAWMMKQKIINPELMTRMLAPGFRSGGFAHKVESDDCSGAL